MTREDMLVADVKIYQGSDNWSALYINGKLDYVGDHSNVTERVYELFNVGIDYSDSFKLGKRNAQREDIAKTEAEIEAYDDLREGAQRRLEELQSQADKLRKEFNLR